MNILRNQLLQRPDGRKFAFDLQIPEGPAPEKGWPLLIFAHGFKGFKDWGHWEALGNYATERGVAFLKFNFSHNGVTIEKPLDFADLEAFGHNNFSKELQDAKLVLKWLAQNAAQQSIDLENMHIIGHSRGGPIAILTAAQSKHIQSVITWASVHELNYSMLDPKVMKDWKNEGVRYILNGRTKQNMPLYYQLVEDWEEHEDDYSIKDTLEELEKPLLILHGSADPAIPESSAEYLLDHAQHGTMHIIQGADHVFNGSHPFLEEDLPAESKELMDKTLEFVKG